MRGGILKAASWAMVLSVCVSARAQVVRVTDAFGDPPSPSDVLEFFNAIDEGLVDARVVMRDQYHGKIVLENLTDLPLALNLPQFAAAQPILAQPILAQQGFFGQPGNNSSTFSGQAGQQPQSVGGMPQSQPFGRGSGPFNIAPEQVRTIDFPCFCLEQGKPNPRSAVKYKIVPLEKANADPRLPELLAAYARGGVDRETAQAAVWHVASEMSWDNLARLSQMIALNAERPVFSVPQLRTAKSLVEDAEKRAATATTKAASREKPAATEPTAVSVTPTKQTARRERDRI